MVDDKTLETFAKQLESFETGFNAITQNLQTQLKDVNNTLDKLQSNTSFMPKIMTSNKEIKNTGEKIQVLVDTLLARLDGICEDKGIM